MTRQVTVDIDEGILLVIQDLVKVYGVVTACVYGRMWDYCTRKDGVCRASMGTIGKDLGLDRATVNRSAKTLVEAGYLEDLTPYLINHPHHYRDTGKAGLRMSLTAYSGVAQNSSSDAGVAEISSNGAKKRRAGVAEISSKNGKKSLAAEICNTEASGVADFPLNVVVVKQNLLIDKQQQQAIEALKRAGVGKDKAIAMARLYPLERITLAVDVYAFMRHQKIARGQGYLIDFLEGEWSPPAEYIPKDQRCPECWGPVNNHARDCSNRKRSEFDVICPYCHSYPCSCEEEPEVEPAT